MVKKSESSTLYSACLLSACCILSAGFSRGSCILKAETIMATSERQFSLSAANSILASFGSVGIFANCRPIAVIFPCLSKAFTSCNEVLPSRIILSSGGSRKGKSSISPSFNDVICKITDDKLVRKISGSVNWGRAKKSSSEYKRMQIPSATRPQRPAL